MAATCCSQQETEKAAVRHFPVTQQGNHAGIGFIVDSGGGALINVAEISRKYATGISGWRRRWLEAVLRVLLHEKEFVEFARKYPYLSGVPCIEQIFSYFQLRCETDITELENIPAEGPVVLVANHPIGSLDGLALLKTIASARPDVKIVANRMLSSLKPLQDLFIGVNNMGASRARRHQVEAIQTHLNQGGALIVFPAGEVSRLSLAGIRDRRWNNGFLRLAAMVEAPIVPIHVRGRNSIFFYFVSLLLKPLSTYMLVDEMFKQRGKRIQIRIGGRIPCSQSTKLSAQTFRRHVYLIGQGKAGCLPGEAPIALPQNHATLKAAVEACEMIGTMSDGKRIYIHRFEAEGTISPILLELGRLREIAFRAVGEGSGRRLDLDKYDQDYFHLLLWEPTELEIVGAYRFTPTARLIEKKGLEGLYSHSLFNYGAEMDHVLERGVELGRSFVQPKYWGKRGLDYLWHGIGAYLARYPEYRYLFGPVSISGTMPQKARDLLVSFYRSHFSPQTPAATSRHPYSAPLADWLFSRDYQEDLVYLKSALSEMGCSIPTLYKQYTELCEPGGVQFMDFGVDPEFNGCVDGLVVVDISTIKPSRYQRYIAPYLQNQTLETWEPRQKDLLGLRASLIRSRSETKTVEVEAVAA
jgi:putative hemolysin